MKVIFFKNLSDNKTCVKELTDPVEKDIIIKTVPMEGIDIMDPVFIIKMDKSLYKYNYCYIEDFGKYYYFNTPKVVNNNLLRVNMHVDVLQTYWEEFKGNNAIVDRAENVFNLYLQDGKLPVEQKTIIRRYVTKETPFDGTSMILLCTGPGGSPDSEA